MEHLNNNSVNH